MLFPKETQPSSPDGDKSGRWMIFGFICLVYFLVYFHRVSTSVIVADLLAAFNTNATALGFMSSMYFYLYAFEQPLVGYLADRIGPRRVIGYWSIAAAAGCFLFAAAPTIGWAMVGRGLIGIGVGGVYVPALKALSVWFREKEFAGMLGLLMSVGNLGGVIATTPLAWSAAHWGFRYSFTLIGGVTLCLALLTLLKIPDRQATSSPTPQKSISARGDGVSILTSLQFWIMAVILFTGYGTLITLQGLWLAPFLTTVMGMERIAASNLNMLIPVGVIVGSPLIGWLSDRWALDKRRLLVGIICIYAATWIALIFYFARLGSGGLAMLMLLMGTIAGGFISVAWTIVRESSPARLVGLASGLMNPAPILGVAAFQVLSGIILDLGGRVGDLYTPSGYHYAFLACLAANLLSLVLAVILCKYRGLYGEKR